MLMSAAEVVRVAEDFGRFQLPLLLFRRPYLGWTHGSWLLINGAVENAIGWDTDNVCEDYWFGYHVSTSPRFNFNLKSHSNYANHRLQNLDINPNGFTAFSANNHPVPSKIYASSDDVGSLESSASSNLLRV